MILVWYDDQPLAFVPVPLARLQRDVSVEQLQAAILPELGGDLWQAALVRHSEQQGLPLATLPPFSVVVCTRERPESLARCLGSLQHLDYPVYEVVVVDNASRDQATAAVVERAGVRYVYEPRPGLDWARNRGWNEATYDLIAYTDDDVVVDPGWLRGLAHSFAAPEVAVTTGAILPLELETEAQLLFETYGGMHKGFKRICFRPADLRYKQMIASHETGVGANMAFRRTALAHVGGFDTALDVGTPSGGAGDLDMFHRIMVAGLTL
ncbi:MAG: glycosyltransferase, partial [Chloroflexia bacterium]|nr:glycosyltransferase [Chloroflexia bacterium]